MSFLPFKCEKNQLDLWSSGKKYLVYFWLAFAKSWLHAKINILLYHNFYFQNPNTRYEANFIPIFTLSDWNLSENDAPKVENGLLIEYKNKHSLGASKVS